MPKPNYYTKRGYRLEPISGPLVDEIKVIAEKEQRPLLKQINIVLALGLQTYKASHGKVRPGK